MGTLYAHPDVRGLERFCLARLRRFAELAATAGAPPGQSSLARHATLAAYRDCVALGVEDTAREILRRVLEPAGADGR
jgi:hypothetical protein